MDAVLPRQKGAVVGAAVGEFGDAVDAGAREQGLWWRFPQRSSGMGHWFRRDTFVVVVAVVVVDRLVADDDVDAVGSAAGSGADDNNEAGVVPQAFNVGARDVQVARQAFEGSELAEAEAVRVVIRVG